MEVIQKIKIDLLKPGVKPVVNVMQADENSRVIEIALYVNGIAWEIPAGANFSMAYKKPDGTKGLYDTMPDGSSASSVIENVISIRLAPQMLTSPGTVTASVVISVDDQRVSTFPVIVNVIRNPAAGAVGSEDYFYSSVIGNLDDLKTTDKSSLVAAINEAMSKSGTAGGYYTPVVTQPTTDTMKIAFVPSVATMPAVEPVTITLPGSDSGQNVALTTAQINALDGMFKVCVFDDSLGDVKAAYAAFKSAFGITDSGEEEPDIPVVPEVMLTSISAVYSGGSVPVGTAVADLNGIVVTAHYSDGTSETVAGYTLSGTIVEGSNTVTVSYGGKTTTFTVTGVAESGGETPEILYELAEPTTFDGTTSIDTGWSPLAEDKDFTIVGKVVTVMTEGRIADAIKYIYPEGTYGLRIANGVAGRILISANVAGTQTIVGGEGNCTINNFVITHAKGSDVCNVALYYERTGITTNTKYEEIPFPVVPEIAETMVLASGFTGTINDFKIYSRVFTDDEIEAYIA